MPRTKIICTAGPASSSESALRRMMLAGMDAVRLNFSHGKPEALGRVIETVRLLNSRYRRRVRVLGDLQGHRIRIGALPAGAVTLKKGAVLKLVQGSGPGDAHRLTFDYAGPLRGIRNGFRVYIDDGLIALEVTGRSRKALTAKVISGGVLKEHKGVNIPEASLEFGPINGKDISDIRFCLDRGVDYIAQSFVRSKKDVREVRRLIPQGSRARVVAKIEDREGIRNIDSIIGASDGIMIARGDMGVSVPVYEIPVIQKMIIRKCNTAKKPVITATQMLESMTENPRPTRAEVTDVANAILDGTDFVMLSAESAVGRYPVESVAMMNDIIRFTEKSFPESGARRARPRIR